MSLAMEIINKRGKGPLNYVMFESKLELKKSPPNGSPCHVFMEEWITMKSPKNDSCS
jgi:hypothetical protein